MGGAKLVWLFPLAFAAVTAAFADESADPKLPVFEPVIEPAQVRPHVEFLASPEMAGRSSPESKARARAYLIEQFQSAKLQPLFPTTSNGGPGERSFEQAIPGADEADGKIPILGYNVGAWLPGSDSKLADEVIIVSAHYDHLGTRNGFVFAGADDNASGVAMMLEVARQLSTDKTLPRRSIAFVAFDLEERLLWGSRWFASHSPWPMERIKLFITADLIGRSLGDLPLPAVFVFGSERSPQLRAGLNKVGLPNGLEACRLGTDIVGTRSDYGAFRDRQVPFLFFSTGEHPDYHTPDDTPDKIEYEKLARIASLILELTRHFANVDQAPIWSEPVQEGLEEPRSLHRITTLLLDADKQKPLTSTQRFLVTNVHNRTRQMIDANKMTPDDRVWLVRTAQLLMLSVF